MTISARVGTGGAVVAHRVSALRHLGRTGTFEQNGIREALHLRQGDTGLVGNLFDGGAGTDAGLDFAGPELTVHFDLNLAESSDVPAGCSAEFVIGGKPEFFAGTGICAHDVRTIGLETDHSKLSHVDLLIAPARDSAPRQL